MPPLPLSQLDAFQARLREVEILGGEVPSLAAYGIQTALGKLFDAFPTVLNPSMDKSAYSALTKAVEKQIRLFSDAIEKQLSFD